MKNLIYSKQALRDLQKYRSDAKRLIKKIDRYALEDAGDVTQLVSSSGKRLRIGDFRIIFEESDTTIIITTIGPRGSIYEGL